MAREISLQGKSSLTGVVVKSRMTKTVIVEWERVVDIPKYERYEKRRSRVAAHNPDSIKAKEGDLVRIRRTRPLSKTKHFIVVEKLGREKEFELKQEGRELAKVKEEKKEEQNESSES